VLALHPRQQARPRPSAAPVGCSAALAPFVTRRERLLTGPARVSRVGFALLCVLLPIGCGGRLSAVAGAHWFRYKQAWTAGTAGRHRKACRSPGNHTRGQRRYSLVPPCFAGLSRCLSYSAISSCGHPVVLALAVGVGIRRNWRSLLWQVYLFRTDSTTCGRSVVTCSHCTRTRSHPQGCTHMMLYDPIPPCMAPVPNWVVHLHIMSPNSLSSCLCIPPNSGPIWPRPHWDTDLGQVGNWDCTNCMSYKTHVSTSDRKHGSHPCHEWCYGSWTVNSKYLSR
jgi:hypothetical protein